MKYKKMTKNELISYAKELEIELKKYTSNEFINRHLNRLVQETKQNLRWR